VTNSIGLSHEDETRGLISPLDRKMGEIRSLITRHVVKRKGEGMARKKKPSTRREKITYVVIPSTDVPCAHRIP
jgi:hypothetical protein